MARRKQRRPTRPSRANGEFEGENEECQSNQASKRPRRAPSLEANNAKWRSLLVPKVRREDGKEVAEINLLVTSSASGFSGPTQINKEKAHKHATLRVRLQLLKDSNFNMTGAGVFKISRQDLMVQVLINHEATSPGDFRDGPSSDDYATSEIREGSEDFKAIISGELDGPDAAVTALAFLIRQGYVGLTPAPCQTCALFCCWDHGLAGRLRVIIRKKAFSSSEGPMKSWMRDMQTLMSWLRPELVSEIRTRGLGLFSRYAEEMAENLERVPEPDCTKKEHVFDPTALYDAVKPPRTAPSLDTCFPELLPDLRPYQRRAAYWMVQRERGFGTRFGSYLDTSETRTTALSDLDCPSTSMKNSMTQCFSNDHPMWFSVLPLDGSSEFFFNPYIGAVSLEPRDSVSYVNGGILADEMGLGKTVEVLACIFANPYKDLLSPSAAEKARKLLHLQIASRKRERVDCACGAMEENEGYEGSWIQCDSCDAWQHATCVGYGSAAEIAALQTERIIARRQGNKMDPSRGREVMNGGLEPVKGPAGHLDISKARKLRKIYNMPKPIKRGPHEEDLSKLENYVCGACAALIGSVEVKGGCRATLIVCPTPILQQWQDEILRHTRTGSLRVIVYEGVSKGAFILTGAKRAVEKVGMRLNVVSAHDLAAADVVLATYDTLRTDLSHDPDRTKSNQRSLRYIKRYPVVPTPLTRLRWWRICLDEAQMVEGNTSLATEMALLLDAQNRWCVSGTPIQRGLDDLFGLLRFLQLKPFNDPRNWNWALRRPYEAGDARAISYMHKLVGLLMWRSSKSQVKDELNLPPQEECLSWLHFSAVEAHFYRQQHENCAVKAREVIEKHGQHEWRSRGTPDSRVFPPAQFVNKDGYGTLEGESSLSDAEKINIITTDLGELAHQNRNALEESGSSSSGQECLTNDLSTSTNGLTRMNKFSNVDVDRSLSRSEASLIFTSLLKLRQACCHPQVGGARIRSLQHRSPMTMDEILQVLVCKAKVEAEEAQRILIGALNGLGALAAIDKDIPLAVSIYREALALTEENAPDVDVDPLQKLHTLHNLAEVMGISSSPPYKEGSWNGAEAQPSTIEGTCQTMEGAEVNNLVSLSETSVVLESVAVAQDVVSKGTGEVPGSDKLTNIWVEDENSSTETMLSSLGGDNQQQVNQSVNLLASKVPWILRDDVLIKQSQEIRLKYMASFQTKLGSAWAEFETASVQVAESKRDCEANGGSSWWLEVLAGAETRDDGGEDLVNKIRDHLLETDNLGKRGRHRNASSLALRF